MGPGICRKREVRTLIAKWIRNREQLIRDVSVAVSCVASEREFHDQKCPHWRTDVRQPAQDTRPPSCSHKTPVAYFWHEPCASLSTDEKSLDNDFIACLRVFKCRNSRAVARPVAISGHSTTTSRNRLHGQHERRPHEHITSSLEFKHKNHIFKTSDTLNGSRALLQSRENTLCKAAELARNIRPNELRCFGPIFLTFQRRARRLILFLSTFVGCL